MNRMILAQAMQEKVIAQGFDLARDVTPASMAGYAFAVIVLVVGLYVFFKLYANEKSYNREVSKAMGDFNQKSLEVLVSVKGRLDDQQRMGENITEIRHHMDSLGNKFDTLSQKLDRAS